MYIYVVSVAAAIAADEPLLPLLFDPLGERTGAVGLVFRPLNVSDVDKFCLFVLL